MRNSISLLTTLCLSLIGVTNILAQTSIQWQRAYGGTFYDHGGYIQKTSDGGYVLAGTVNSINGDVSGNHGKGDYWVAKLASDGSITWQKCLGGSDREEATAIVQTSDGGYIVVGATKSNDGNVTNHHGGICSSEPCKDYWVVKLDNTGNIEWEKTLGGTNVDIASSVQETFDGGFVIAGVTYSNDGDITSPLGGADYWIVKLDVNGNLVWERSLGGSNNDSARDIKQTADNGLIIVGTSNSNDGDVTGNHGAVDCWIVKLDPFGNIQWQKSIGGSYGDRGWSIQQTFDLGYIIGGIHTTKVFRMITGL